MKKYFIQIIIATIVMALNACSNKTDVNDMVTKYISANNNPNDEVQIIEINKPDSTFGITYLPEKEILFITKTTESITDYFMKKTNNMTSYDPNDGYLAYLANKQMLVSAQLNEILARSMVKKNFNGWFVKATYTVTNNKNKRKTVEYLFLDKEQSLIYNSFSVPIP